jgi:hypothetical protein
MAEEFICERCKKSFPAKWKLIRHQNKKIKCIMEEKKLLCKYCHKKLSRSDCFKKHLLLCKKKHIRDRSFKPQVKLKTLDRQYLELISEKSILTNDVIQRYINKYWQSIPELIRFTNFNPNFPQYHNIYYTNLSHSYCYVFNNNKWRIEKITKVISDLVLPILIRMIEYFKDPEIVIASDIVKNFIEIMQTFDKYYSLNCLREDSEDLDDIKTKIEQSITSYPTSLKDYHNRLKAVSKERDKEIIKDLKLKDKTTTLFDKNQIKQINTQIKYLLYSEKDLVLKSKNYYATHKID